MATSVEPSCAAPHPELHVDACGLECPQPLLLFRQAFMRVGPGGLVHLHCDDMLSVVDVEALLPRIGGHMLAVVEQDDGTLMLSARREQA